MLFFGNATRAEKGLPWRTGRYLKLGQLNASLRAQRGNPFGWLAWLAAHADEEGWIAASLALLAMTEGAGAPRNELLLQRRVGQLGFR